MTSLLISIGGLQVNFKAALIFLPIVYAIGITLGMLMGYLGGDFRPHLRPTDRDFFKHALPLRGDHLFQHGAGAV